MSARLSLLVAQWPAADRAAWERATAPGDVLFGDGAAAGQLSPRTLGNYANGYGQFLAFLLNVGELDPSEDPAARVTFDRMNRWMAAMLARGLRPTSRRQALTHMHAALKLLAPTVDLDWIIRPRGRPLKKAIPGGPKPVVARDTRDGMKHVRALHQSGLADPGSIEGRQALRDAALIAILLIHGPRVGAVVRMTLTRHIRQNAQGLWSLHFTAEDNKTPKAMDAALDAECSAMLGDYLTQARSDFARAGTSDQLWMGMKGPLTVVGLQRICRRRTLAWFGKAYGPHAMRHWLRSTAARISPELAFDASEVLGHSPEVSLQHYAEASGLHAALRHGAHLRRLRRKNRGRASRASETIPKETPTRPRKSRKRSQLPSTEALPPSLPLAKPLAGKPVRRRNRRTP